jgi:hypothetical protein
MFIPDPDFFSHKYHKIENCYVFEQVSKNFEPIH